MSVPITLGLPTELIEDIAARVAAVIETETTEPTPWLSAEEAAEYLGGWPRERIYKLTSAGAIPHRKVGKRLLFRREELDAWLDEHYEGPPRPLAAGDGVSRRFPSE